MSGSQIFETPSDLETARLMILKQAVRLESVGMRHSSGKSMRKAACKALGLTANTGYDSVIGALNREIGKRLTAKHEAHLHDVNASQPPKSPGDDE